MPKFDEKALDKFIEDKLNPPALPAKTSRRALVDKLLRLGRDKSHRLPRLPRI